MKFLSVFWLLIVFMSAASQADAGDATDDPAWIVGKWQLAYDPDDAATDWLEFMPEGDVFNITPDGGRTPGFYLVSGNEVKAVFTLNEKDVIMIFHSDAKRDALRIVTSLSGQASVYRKVRP